MKLTLTLEEARDIIRKQLGLTSNVPIEITNIALVLTSEQYKKITEIGNLILNHNLIAAIKDYRVLSGVGLWEAKAVIENWLRAKEIFNKGHLVTAQRSIEAENGVEIIAI